MTIHRILARAAAFSLVIAALEFGAFTLGAPGATQAQARWFKGKTQKHTINSDGDTAPDEVVRW